MTAVKTDGTLWAWGYNRDGQLGQNSRTDYSSPIQVGSDTTWDTVYRLSSFAIRGFKTDGTMWVWGANGPGGQLGLNNQTGYSSPVQIPGTEWTASTPGIFIRKDA